MKKGGTFWKTLLSRFSKSTILCKFSVCQKEITAEGKGEREKRESMRKSGKILKGT